MMVTFVGSGVSYLKKKKKICSKEAGWSLNRQEVIAIFGKQARRYTFYAVSFPAPGTVPAKRKCSLIFVL